MTVGSVTRAPEGPASPIRGLDRICVAAVERRPVVERWRRLFGAETTGEGRLACWSAHRTALRVGRSAVEVLEADGVGLLADHLGRKGAGLFALGIAVDEPGRILKRFERRGSAVAEHADQVFLASDRGVDLPGLHLVFSAPVEGEAAGSLERLVGATCAVEDHRGAARDLAALLGLAGEAMEPLSRANLLEASVLRLASGAPDHVAFAWPWYPRSPFGRALVRREPGPLLATARLADRAALEEACRTHGVTARRAPGALLLEPGHLGGWRSTRRRTPGRLAIRPRPRRRPRAERAADALGRPSSVRTGVGPGVGFPGPGRPARDLRLPGAGRGRWGDGLEDDVRGQEHLSQGALRPAREGAVQPPRQAVQIYAHGDHVVARKEKLPF